MEDGGEEWVVNHKQCFTAVKKVVQNQYYIAGLCGQIPEVEATDDLLCKSVKNDCKANVYLGRVWKINCLCYYSRRCS